MNFGITNVKRTVRYWRLEFAEPLMTGAIGKKLGFDTKRVYLNPIDGRVSHDARLNPAFGKNDRYENRRLAQIGRNRVEERAVLAAALSADARFRLDGPQGR